MSGSRQAECIEEVTTVAPLPSQRFIRMMAWLDDMDHAFSSHLRVLTQSTEVSKRIAHNILASIGQAWGTEALIGDLLQRVAWNAQERMIPNQVSVNLLEGLLGT